MGLIDGLHNVPERFKRCCSSLAPPPTNNNKATYSQKKKKYTLDSQILMVSFTEKAIDAGSLEILRIHNIK